MACFFVDLVNGCDKTGDGSPEKPFKSEKRALEEMNDNPSGENCIEVGNAS